MGQGRIGWDKVGQGRTGWDRVGRGRIGWDRVGQGRTGWDPSLYLPSRTFIAGPMCLWSRYAKSCLSPQN